MNPVRRNQLAAVLLLAVGGIVRLPVEQSVTDDFRKSELLPPKLDTRLRDQMSQETFAAAAGGLRSLLASGYEIAAFQAFYERPPRFDLVDKYYALCCQLQPREWRYWDTYGWMLSRNAGSYYAEEGGATKGLEATERRKWRQRGLEIYLRGITQNPEAYWLYRSAAFLVSETHPALNPHPDHKFAAVLFKRGSETTSANKPPAFAAKYLRRFAIYQLAQIPGDENVAYHLLLDLYARGESERLPTTIAMIKRFEVFFHVPLSLRIPERRLMDDIIANVQDTYRALLQKPPPEK